MHTYFYFQNCLWTANWPMSWSGAPVPHSLLSMPLFLYSEFDRFGSYRCPHSEIQSTNTRKYYIYIYIYIRLKANNSNSYYARDKNTCTSQCRQWNSIILEMLNFISWGVSFKKKIKMKSQDLSDLRSWIPLYIQYKGR